jgi:hypothetical protein
LREQSLLNDKIAEARELRRYRDVNPNNNNNDDYDTTAEFGMIDDGPMRYCSDSDPVPVPAPDSDPDPDPDPDSDISHGSDAEEAPAIHRLAHTDYLYDADVTEHAVFKRWEQLMADIVGPARTEDGWTFVLDKTYTRKSYKAVGTGICICNIAEMLVTSAKAEPLVTPANMNRLARHVFSVVVAAAAAATATAPLQPPVLPSERAQADVAERLHLIRRVCIFCYSHPARCSCQHGDRCTRVAGPSGCSCGRWMTCYDVSAWGTNMDEALRTYVTSHQLAFQCLRGDNGPIVVQPATRGSVRRFLGNPRQDCCIHAYVSDSHVWECEVAPVRPPRGYWHMEPSIIDAVLRRLCGAGVLANFAVIEWTPSASSSSSSSSSASVDVSHWGHGTTVIALRDTDSMEWSTLLLDPHKTCTYFVPAGGSRVSALPVSGLRGPYTTAECKTKCTPADSGPLTCEAARLFCETGSLPSDDLVRVVPFLRWRIVYDLLKDNNMVRDYIPTIPEKSMESLKDTPTMDKIRQCV